MKNRKALIFVRILSLILVVTNMSVIFYFSSRNAAESGKESADTAGKLLRIIYRSFDKLSADEKADLVESYQKTIRKTAHVVEYASLGFLLMTFMLTFDKKNMTRGFISFGVGALNAVSDEIHQAFIPGRSPEVRDVLIDCAGVLSGILIIILLRSVYTVCKKRRTEK